MLVLSLLLLYPPLRSRIWNPLSIESIREKVLGEECILYSHESEVLGVFNYKSVSTLREGGLLRPVPPAHCNGRIAWQARKGLSLSHAVIEEELLFDRNCELVSLERMRETGNPQDLRELEKFARTNWIETRHGCVWLPGLQESKAENG